MADARIDPDGSVQSLEDHLHAAADISASFLKPAGLAETGRLLGEFFNPAHTAETAPR